MLSLRLIVRRLPLLRSKLLSLPRVSGLTDERRRLVFLSTSRDRFLRVGLFEYSDDCELLEPPEFRRRFRVPFKGIFSLLRLSGLIDLRLCKVSLLS